MTVPDNGERGVAPQTGVWITFSSAFNSKVDAQEDLTSPEGIVVVGEITGQHTGTIEVKTEEDALVERSASQEAAALPAASNAGVLEQVTSKIGGADTTSGDSGNSGDTGDGSGDTTDEPKENTLVFTLEAGDSFAGGEWVHVQVGKPITVHGTPIRNYEFTFRVRGEDARAEMGDLRVTATSPLPETMDGKLRQTVSATFSQAVKPDNLPGGMIIRGEHSGVHQNVETTFPQKESDERILEMHQRLQGEDGFLPGEWVTVTLKNEIQAVDAAASSGTTSVADALSGNIPGVQYLPSYRIRFQVAPGKVKNDQWASIYQMGQIPEPAGVIGGNLDPYLLGTEFVAFGPRYLELFSLVEAGKWEGLQLEGPGQDERIVDARVGDLNNDGYVELVLLLDVQGDTRRSRVAIYDIGAEGSLVEREGTREMLEMGVVGVKSLLLSDLDGNGYVDLLITHPSQIYRVQDEDGSYRNVSSGNLSIIQGRWETPDPTKIDPTKISTTALEPKLVYHLVENPIPLLDPVERLELQDLDWDGKPDLIAEILPGTEGEEATRRVVLIQNRSTRQNPFYFLIQRPLRGRGGSGLLSPRAWVAADLDGDGDIDILAWDSKGAALYRNALDPDTQDLEKLEVRGLLFEDALPVGLDLPASPADSLPVLARDLNGDHAVDLAFSGNTRRKIYFLPGVPNEPLRFDTYREFPTGAAGKIAGLTVADADSDTGLDFIVLGDRSSDGYPLDVIRAFDVEPPGLTIQPMFRIDEDLSKALDDPLLDEVHVVITADIPQSYNAYTLVLEYDENRISYLGFQEPEKFQGQADFITCPDASGNGCAGFASVRMTTRSSSTGGTRVWYDGTGIVLGTFIFRPHEVESAGKTYISLAGEELDDGDGNKLKNELTLSDGSSSSKTVVELAGDPYEVELKVAALRITDLSLDSFEDGEYLAHVTWESRLKNSFSRFQVLLNGDSIGDVDGQTREKIFSIISGGTHSVAVRGYLLDGTTILSKEQFLHAVFEPFVLCRRRGINNWVKLEWSIDGQVDRFRIFRNGEEVLVVSGEVTSVESSAIQPTNGSGAILYEIIGAIDVNGGLVEGPPGSCRIEDMQQQKTESPDKLNLVQLARTSPGDPIHLKMSWSNGEAYDSIQLRVYKRDGTEAHSVELPGTATEYVYEGDPFRGGVQPGIFHFSLVGVSSGIYSLEEEAESVEREVNLPSLNSSLSCETSGGEVILTWERVWAGYTSLQLKVDRLDENGEYQELRRELLNVSRSEYRDSVVPVGTYQYTLIAAYDLDIPNGLRPDEGSLRKSCSFPITFKPLAWVEGSRTGVALQNVLIPVRANLFSEVQGIRFSINLPEELLIGDPGSALRLNGLSPEAEVAAEPAGDVPDDDEGRHRQQIRYTVRNASFTGGNNQVLLWIVGGIEANFDSAGEYPLSLEGPFEILPPEGGDDDWVSIEIEDRKATLDVLSRYLVVERKEVNAGDLRPSIIRILTTYNMPEEIQYTEKILFLAFSIHIRFDPNLLTLLPVRASDQLETVVGDTGWQIPQSDFFQKQAQEGWLNLAWLTPDFSLTETPFKNEGILQTLLVLKFKHKVPENPTGAYASIVLVKPPELGATTFKPEFDQRDRYEGKFIQEYFPGGIEILPDREIPTLLSVMPSVGSQAGGAEVLVNGYGFLAGGGSSENIHLQFVHPDSGTSLPAELIEGRPLKDHLLEFRVPEFETAEPFSMEFDLHLEAPGGNSTLESAFTYEPLRITGSDIASGTEDGNELKRRGSSSGCGTRMAKRPRVPPPCRPRWRAWMGMAGAFSCARQTCTAMRGGWRMSGSSSPTFSSPMEIQRAPTSPYHS